jgi:hypothetical protein
MRKSALSLVFAAVALYAFAATAAPLSVPEVQLGREAPVRASQWEVYTKSVGTTAVHAFNVDLTTGAGDAAYLQEVRISNRHASQGLCYGVVAYSSACATQCGASTITCSGAATDGDFVAPGTSITLPISGADCACVIASAAATTSTAARVKRALQ